MVEYKAISTSIIFMEYSSLCAMLLWITAVSAREAFVLRGLQKSLKFNPMFVPGWDGKWEPLRSTPCLEKSARGWRTEFQCVTFWQKCLGEEIWDPWRAPAIGSSFPSLKPDSSDKCHKQEAENKSGIHADMELVEIVSFHLKKSFLFFFPSKYSITEVEDGSFYYLLAYFWSWFSHS